MIPASLPPALGNAHLVLLHLPIGFVFAAVLLELWTRREPAAGGRLVEKLLAVNAVAALLTAAAGLVLAERGDYPEAALAWHRWAGVACAVAAVLAWWLRSRRGPVAGRVGLGLLVVATVVAGHQGAALTHGGGLFSRAAWTGGEAPAELPAALAGVPMHPVIERHCVECHGPEKQKGRLRLDTLAAARAGRGGRPVLVPGDAEAGELVKRINLPRSHDDAMPPGERAGLSAAEKEELAAWISGLAR